MTPSWLSDPIAVPSVVCMAVAKARQEQLTKPRGSLGRLEEMAMLLAGLQDREYPAADRVGIAIFAADHGVAVAGISPYPQSVTVEMIRNFSRGGAAINVLARMLQARLEVVDVGALLDPGPLPGVVSKRAGAGTRDFRFAPAMTHEEWRSALQAGAEAAWRAAEEGCDLFIGGEMGIGNTTSAAALASALMRKAPELLAGPGAGLDPVGVARKVAVIEESLTRHRHVLNNPVEMLIALGGFEIVALVGAFIAAAQRRIPVLVDGFIASVAALYATRLRGDVRPWLLFAHESAEPGHRLVLDEMQAAPLLRLGMRLGEASGAAVAVPVLRLACALHREMATFAEAGISAG
ncbi:MAG: nicotinate-nucleotide--dimethylbenzimidazole phosphoribosyltransferase [Magnetococcales bacterium]|nr:nicotinate-nucleotide--dimethylbenzimidazole phosphoribosyltransferase [Magnetococcales bacterium]NGZ04898.1 nicotinate-nucleotide--dimethylbenzimidazole phosphoribosyltransferase [Magnetococcales bacterium]